MDLKFIELCLFILIIDLFIKSKPFISKFNLASISLVFLFKHIKIDSLGNSLLKIKRLSL